ncbi:putative transport protein [Planctomycetota bacterium]|nr:putative transport protein [Planctomycetota bacterium]
MSWFAPLLHGDGVAGLILVLGIVIASGIALGSIKIRGISLGIAGVLFTGILYGHLAWRDHGPVPAPVAMSSATPAVIAEPAQQPQPPQQHQPPARDVAASHHAAEADRIHLLEFLREFGLIFFVFSIGMQLGPGFFSSLRDQGLRWNLLAASVVLLGTGMGILAWAVGGLPAPLSVGLLSGAVTNTPGLAAATQALKDSVPGASAAELNLPAMGYAVAYPFGVLGVILSMIALRLAFRIDPLAEASAFRAAGIGSRPAPTDADLEVKNPGLAGRTVANAITLAGGKVAVSRLMRGTTMVVPELDRVLQIGDILHVVGDAASLDRMRMVVGDLASIKLTEVEADLDYRLMLVTNPKAVGRTVADLDLHQECGAAISRISRSGIEFVATGNVRLLFGDQVRVVGDSTGLVRASEILGNSVKQLDHPQMIPVFVGIALGVMLGSIPVLFPGIPAPVKLGLAGGPLVAALVLSRLGRLGGMNFYMSHGANLMIRELGIVLFLACVGLKAGGSFVDTVIGGDGLLWMAWAAAITVVPVIVVGLFARLVLKLNFTALSGLIAGSMTDPPALAFANATTQSESPAVTYATVYPLTMILRVLSAQAFILFTL